MKFRNKNTIKIGFQKAPAVFASIALVFAYVLFGASVLVSSTANATTPLLINFQGKLTAVSDGTNVADGSYDFEFKLYTASTGGTAVWTETYDQVSGSCQSLSVVNGVFNTKLGSCNSLSGIDFSGGSMYLSVNFDDGGGYDGEMSPRKQLTSSAFALVANSVSGTGTINTTVNSSTALTVAQSGSNYAFQVDTSTASSATGLKVTSAAAAGGAALAVISSGTNENLTVDAKGSGTISLGATSTGNILLGGGVGSTGCTITNSSGNFACDGTIDLESGTILDAQSDNSLRVSNSNGYIEIGPKNTGGAHIYTDLSQFIFNKQLTFTGDVGTIQSANGFALTLNSGTTGAINLGTDNSAETISLATGAGVKTLTVGSTNTTSSTTIQSGSGNISLNTASGTIELQDSTNITGVATISSILQVGSATATTYSRLGTGTTGHALDAANDLLVSDDLEVDGDAWFDGNLTVAGTCTGCGTTISFGSDNQIPFTNGTTDDFDYSSDFTYDATTLTVTTASTTASNKTINIAQTGATTGTDYAGYFTNTGAATTNVGLYASASGGTNNYAAIFENGNVGIGTTTPDTALHIEHGNNAGFVHLKATGTNVGPFILLEGDSTSSYPSIEFDRSQQNRSSTLQFTLNGTDEWTVGELYNGGFANTGFSIANGSDSLSNALLHLSTSNAVGIKNTSPSALLTLGTAGTTAGTLSLAGSTSGTITVQTQAAAGTYNFNLPTTAGTSGYVLTSGGGGATAMSWTDPSTFGVKWSSLAAPSGNLTLAHGSNVTDFSFNGVTTGNAFSLSSSSVTSGSVLNLASTSTAAASNTQKVLNVATSGANGTSSQTTYGAYFSNTHTGTSSTNIAAYFTASGGTSNYAAVFDGDIRTNIDSTTVTMVGVGAGANNNVSGSGDEGLYNTFFGAQAGNSNTIGAYNNFFGYQAGLNVTSGQANFAQGHQSLQNNATGSYNVALGFRAAQGTASQNINGNIAIGYQAGQLLGTGGDYNILMGYQAGNNITGGSKNIVIGYDIDAPSASSTQTLNIGNLLYASGLDGTGTTLSSGSVGIGVASSLVGKLHVAGSVTSSGANAVAGIYQTSTLTNSTASGFQFGNRHLVTVSSSVAGTHVGEFIRVTDSTSLSSGQVVRGMEIQAYSGTNNSGINTGLAAYAKTFGIQAETSAQAGGVVSPAAVFAYLNQSSGQESVGNAIRAYSDTIQGTDLVSLYHETSTGFSGNGIVMNFGNNSGTFTGNFISLQKAGTESFHVDDDGSTFVSFTGTGTANAVCHANNGSVNNDELVDCTSSPAADFAEFYPLESGIEVGEVVVTGSQMINTYENVNGRADWSHVKGQITQLVRSTESYQDNIIGVVSDNRSDFAVTGANIKPEDNPVPVALKGRVNVKVTAENGAIKAGDYLTSSAEQPGFAAKATSSGQVIGRAMADFNPTQEQPYGFIMVFMQVGYQQINNRIVLSAPEITGQNLQGDEQENQDSLLTNTASTFVIQQQADEESDAVSNILQLQSGDSNRFMVSSTGATSILSSLNCSEEGECPSVLKVTQANTELVNIDARGNLKLTGTIFIKEDSFAGSVATDNSGLAEISFAYHLGTGKPVVQLTAESQIPVFAQIVEFKQDTNGNYTGFVMRTFDLIAGPVSAIVHYNVTGKQDGYITLGTAVPVQLDNGSGGDDFTGIVIEDGQPTVVGGPDEPLNPDDIIGVIPNDQPSSDNNQT
ncbi:MAG: hypothetical protein R3B41_00710 [Candidatus Doudnabacteria bacterium]